ncbi:stationary phase inducible protein CsiE [Erwiniaceae bacterium CAU 1747]
MTSEDSPQTSVFSRQQRRCHLILMLCLPEPAVTLDMYCQLNGVEDTVARQDIAEVSLEIQRYHQLIIEQDQQGAIRLSGAQLNQRLCLLHGLRRALRLSPDFVGNYFTPMIRQHLQRNEVSKALYDEHNLQALIQHCSRQLTREFNVRDRHFLQVYLQYSLAHHCLVDFTPEQVSWLSAKMEYALAQEILRCWHRQGYQQTSADDAIPLAMLFSQLHIPDISQPVGEYESRLLLAVKQLILRFQHLSGMQFRCHDELCAQLFSHLAQALERVQFAVGIDHTLVEDVARQYPRLLRTTRAALVEFEQQFSLSFSEEEQGLIAIIFGAWLVQENALHEKQVLLLTGCDSELERCVEQQLRELTLLPLNIKYLTVDDYQRNSAPKGIALVITPYVTTLPLFSPPLFHAELPLGEHQQRSIRALLES